ncbi:MAG: hypothetical protein Q4D58_10155 [Synergistaceae bacterium]|nr:hypothetical protein [Synergistaceae bacterium]
MRTGCERCLVFAAGVVLGASAYAMIKSGKAKKAAVKVLAKGIEIQDKVAEMAEKTKESVSDTVAEARCAADGESC